MSSSFKTTFTSDNVAGTSAEILEALAECSQGDAAPYGNDVYSRRLEEQLSEIFERKVHVFSISTGSAANALSLATFTPQWGTIFCHPDSHINNDECGAPEFYTCGAKLKLIDGSSSKMDVAALKKAASQKVGDVHSNQPSCVSITQATETGSLYTIDEIKEVSTICKESGMTLHMDGARFANALVALDCTPAEMTWKAGVDVLSFGATKNGTMTADAVILFDDAKAQEMAFRRKRAGHLCSKMRFLSAQLSAYLADDLWLRNARQANNMAALLKSGLEKHAEINILGAPATNILFCTMPKKVSNALLEEGFAFYNDRWEHEVVRLVTTFGMTEKDIEYFLERISTVLSTVR